MSPFLITTLVIMAGGLLLVVVGIGITESENADRRRREEAREAQILAEEERDAMKRYTHNERAFYDPPPNYIVVGTDQLKPEDMTWARRRARNSTLKRKRGMV